MVSHDRFFLDQTADVVYEVEAGQLTRYPGNYTRYRAEKRKRLELQRKAYERQQEEIRRLEEVIRRFKNKPAKAALDVYKRQDDSWGAPVHRAYESSGEKDIDFHFVIEGCRE